MDHYERMIIKCPSCGFNVWKTSICPICALMATRYISIPVDELDKATMLSRTAQAEPRQGRAQAKRSEQATGLI